MQKNRGEIKSNLLATLHDFALQANKIRPPAGTLSSVGCGGGAGEFKRSSKKTKEKSKVNTKKFLKQMSEVK